jgi:aspartate/methionine/tyrosine aminotransferase
MPQTVIDGSIVRQRIKKSGLKTIGLATIRELKYLVVGIEEDSGVEFYHMEMGAPAFKPPKIAVEAEIAAIKSGVGAVYPPSQGIPQLAKEISRFIANFMDVKVASTGCFPTVGSMQGCYLAMMMAARRIKGKNKILFIDPGFPVNKRQAKTLALETDSFDVYDFRGEKLEPKLDSYLQKGDIAGVLYSNPNNPSWICFTEKELQTIGRLCSRHDVIALEDLAYLGMDFRKDSGKPGVPPFVPSVAKFTDHYILLMSTSKAFSMAGARLGMTAISDYLFNSEGDNLEDYFGSNVFGRAYIYGAMHAVCSGVCHSTQVGLAALLTAVNDGEYDFLEPIREYGRRAGVLKKLFTDNGFGIVYDFDDTEPLADGFYFTVSYPGFSGNELVEELLYYGIGAISLSTTGSDRHEGIRISVSSTGKECFEGLGGRLSCFHEAHQKGFRALDS